MVNTECGRSHLPVPEFHHSEIFPGEFGVQFIIYWYSGSVSATGINLSEYSSAQIGEEVMAWGAHNHAEKLDSNKFSLDYIRAELARTNKKLIGIHQESAHETI